jgi:TRAP-type C4-dicarboxylate transport system permease small subunit
MRYLLTVVDKATLLLGLLAGAAVVLMMVHVTANVVMVLLFQAPIPGTLALVANYYMPLITFLPLAFVERIENHVSVEVLTQFFPMGAQKHLFGWVFALCCAVCALLAYATWIEALDKYASGTFRIEGGMKVLTWPVRFAAPLSYGLLALLFALKFVLYLAGSDMMRKTRHALDLFHDDAGTGR